MKPKESHPTTPANSGGRVRRFARFLTMGATGRPMRRVAGGLLGLLLLTAVAAGIGAVLGAMPVLERYQRVEDDIAEGWRKDVLSKERVTGKDLVHRLVKDTAILPRHSDVSPPRFFIGETNEVQSEFLGWEGAPVDATFWPMIGYAYVEEETFQRRVVIVQFAP